MLLKISCKYQIQVIRADHGSDGSIGWMLSQMFDRFALALTLSERVSVERVYIREEKKEEKRKKIVDGYTLRNARDFIGIKER